MKQIILYPLLTLLIAVAWNFEKSTIEKEVREESDIIFGWNDTTEFDQEEALAALREEIKGMEDQPASEVFQNIKVMQQVPAGRLLRIMEFGFSRSLGVTCMHCHNPNNFADEDKRQKQITRDMMALAGKINNELLPAVANLDSDNPTVNCTTCHRGEVTPALNLE